MSTKVKQTKEKRDSGKTGNPEIPEHIRKKLENQKIRARKISEAKKGIKRTEAEKAAISEGMRKHYAELRQYQDQDNV